MNPDKLRAYLRRDGWLLAIMALAAVLCLSLSSLEGASSAQSQDEIRLSRVLGAISGAGEVEVAVYVDDDALPCGAVIVADGARDPAVQIRLCSAVTTLLGIEADRVAVYPRATGGTP